MIYCSNDPCETEAVTERNYKPYCFTCAQAFDAGYEFRREEIELDSQNEPWEDGSK